MGWNNKNIQEHCGENKDDITLISITIQIFMQMQTWSWTNIENWSTCMNVTNLRIQQNIAMQWITPF